MLWYLSTASTFRMVCLCCVGCVTSGKSVGCMGTPGLAWIWAGRWDAEAQVVMQESICQANVCASHSGSTGFNRAFPLETKLKCLTSVSLRVCILWMLYTNSTNVI